MRDAHGFPINRPDDDKILHLVLRWPSRATASSHAALSVHLRIFSPCGHARRPGEIDRGGARAGKRRCSCLWQLKFYIEFNCLDHEHIALGFKFELFGINWPSCGGVLLDRCKLLSYVLQQ
jgi:hypothetical protein